MFTKKKNALDARTVELMFFFFKKKEILML